jgi:SAM-dependent methyltransferase
MQPTATLSQSRYDFAAEAARRFASPAATALDIGAGDGRMKPAIEGAGFHWRGFDREANGDIEAWDLNEPCPQHVEASFAILLDVIEHLPNPGLALTNIGTVLVPGAKLVITTPNPRWSRSRFHALATGFPICFTEGDLSNGHVFPTWPHILEELLGHYGFVVTEYATLDGPTIWPRGLSPARYAFAFANKIVERFDRSACGMSYAVVATYHGATR